MKGLLLHNEHESCAGVDRKRDTGVTCPRDPYALATSKSQANICGQFCNQNDVTVIKSQVCQCYKCL